MILEYSDELLRALPVNTHAEKLATAIEWMGPMWVYHPKNRVKRLAEPLPPVFSWKPSKVLRRIK